METTPINAADAPSTPGVYAQALCVRGAAELLFISGQIPAQSSLRAPQSWLGSTRICE